MTLVGSSKKYEPDSGRWGTTDLWEGGRWSAVSAEKHTLGSSNKGQLTGSLWGWGEVL